MKCTNPATISKKGEPTLTAACGKCHSCFISRVTQWSFRLMQEEKTCDSAHFITLTYDTLHIPLTKTGRMALHKRDLQLFFKRLRKAHATNQKPLKYYSVGEYGSTTKRPHYHVILFNADVELIQNAWCCTTSRNISHNTACQCGKHLGEIHYGNVTQASVGYTLKYLSKTCKIGKYAKDDRNKAFKLSSTKLGASYLTPQIICWHHSDLLNRYYCPLPGNIKVSMPRYYKDKIYTSDQRQLISVYQNEKALIEAYQEYLKKPFQQQNQRRQQNIVSYRKLNLITQKNFL